MRNFLFFLFFLLNHYSFSQSREVDSINYYLNSSKNLLRQEKLPKLQRAVFLAKKYEINSLLKKSCYEYGLQSYYNNYAEGVKEANDNILNLYLKSNDTLLLAKYYHFKALYHKLSFENDSAFFYYHKSKNVSKSINDSLTVGRLLLSIALLQKQAKDYLGSEVSSIEALRYLEEIKSFKYLERVYNNLGIVSEELHQNKDALKYYNKALEINNININNEGFLYIINNIGLLHQNKKEHLKAIRYFREGLSFDSIKFKYPLQYALLLENLAASNFLLGNTEDVLNQYKKVLELRTKIGEFKELSTTHINISDYYKKFNQKGNAIFHANEALKYAKQTHNNKRWLEALQLLSELTNGKQSTEYLRQYIQLNDSLIQHERSLKNQFAKIRYETDKKEKENTFLKTENEKKQAEISFHKQQTTIGWLFAIASLLALGLSISFFILRRRKLVYDAQLQKEEARENERQQIAKSLHDEVAGDLRLLYQRLEKSQLFEEAQKLENVKDNVRNLSHQLSSISFDKVSFNDQIINLVSDYFSPNFKIKVTGLKGIEWTEINNSIKRLLFLSVRESIQNSQKHAQATQITINFSVHKKSVFLEITDNGIGFDSSVKKQGIGLYNIQERVEQLKGKFFIMSEVGNGTKTKIQIPLNG
jgi:tetratricopeptide (TPR) repeat protein